MIELRGTDRYRHKTLWLIIACFLVAGLGCSGQNGSSALESIVNSICTSSYSETGGFYIDQVEFRNKLYVSSGVEVDLYASVANCSGTDLENIQFNYVSADGLLVKTTSGATLPLLPNKSKTEKMKFGSFVFDNNSVVGNFKANVLVGGNSYEIQHDFSLGSFSLPQVQISQIQTEIMDGEKKQNDDLFLDPGEKLRFKLKFDNSSDLKVKNLNLNAVSTTGDFVLTGFKQINLGDVEAHANLVSADYVAVDISPQVSSRGGQGKLIFTLKDEFDHVWTKEVDLVVSNLIPQLTIEKQNFQILSGERTANDDDLIDAGEKISFDLTVTNESLFKAKSVRASVTSNSPYFVIESSSLIEISDIGAIGFGVSSLPIQVSVQTNTPQAESAEIQVVVTDEYGDSWNKKFTFQANPNPPIPPKTQVLTLTSNLRFLGFAEIAENASTMWYVLIKEEISGGVNYFRLLKKEASASDFTAVCNMLDDGELIGHLAVDDTNFYVGLDNAIKVFKKSDCSYLKTIQPMQGVSENGKVFSKTAPFSLSVDEGLVLFSKRDSSNDLAYYDPSIKFSFDTPINLATIDNKTFDVSQSFVSVYSSIRWAFERSTGLIWKIDQAGQAMGWAEIPADFSSQFANTNVIATHDGSTLVFSIEDTPGVIKFISASVSGWTTGGNQKISFNSASRSINLGVQGLSSCGQNRSIVFGQSGTGCQSITDINSMSLNVNESFKGIASFGSDHYLLTFETIGSSVSYFRIYKKNSTGHNFGLYCSILDDGKLKGHLAVDADYFYIAQSGSIRKISKSENNCVMIDTVVLSPLMGDNASVVSESDPFTFNLDNNILHYSFKIQKNYTFGISEFNFTTNQTVLNFSSTPALGNKTFNPYWNNRLVSVNSTKWSYDSNLNVIWKLDSNFKPLAWSSLPVDVYPELQYIKSIGSPNGDTLIAVTEQILGQLKFFYFDLTHFESTVGQTVPQSTTVGTFTVPQNFSGCSLGELISSRGGCFKIVSNGSLAISSGEHFNGFTADQNNIYYSTQRYISTPTGWNFGWTAYNYNSANGQSTQICDFVDANNKANLAVDGNKFYVGRLNGILEINRDTGCTPGNTFAPQAGVSELSTSFTSNWAFSLSALNGQVFLTRGDGTAEVSAYDLLGGVSSDLVLSQPLGLMTLGMGRSQVIALQTVKWVHDRSSNSIWKLGADNKAIAWGVLPVNLYPDLVNTKAIATKDGSTLIFATESPDDLGNVKIYYVDVSGF